MRRMFSSSIGLLWVCMISLVFMSSCAKPPTQEIESAEKAIAEAKQKEADLYVQDEFIKAEEALKKAKELISEKKYKEAKAAAETASSSALKAISLVVINREALKEETLKMVDATQKSLDEVKALASAAIRKKSPVSKEELQTAIGQYELDLLSVKDQLQEQKIRAAHDLLVSLNEHIAGQRETLTAAMEQKKEAKR